MPRDDKPRLRRLQGIWKSDSIVRFFTLSFYLNAFSAKSESVGKKCRHKGDCAAIRYSPIRRSFPLMYPLFDCPADSETKGSYPKRSAGIMPRVSKNEYHVLSLSFPHPQSALRCMSTALVFHVRGVCCDARLLLCFFHARRACTDEKSNHSKVKSLLRQATQSQTDERRFVPIYTTAGPRGRQQPTPESFYYSAVKRLNITRRRMLDALLGSGRLKYYLSAKAQRIVRRRMPKVLLIGES